MIYLDHGATSFVKPDCVKEAMVRALECCANPGRGGYVAAMNGAKTVYACRERAADFFDCDPEQVVFTGSCTQGLNTAIFSLVKPGARVVVSGFEHNAVMRPLQALGAKITVAGKKLFDRQDTLDAFQKALLAGTDVAVFTHVSNVFGYILPVEEMARACREAKVPFIIDAAQSAGFLPVKLTELGADFIAVPGHKGLLGPQGTGILLCGAIPKPLVYGGTGSLSASMDMPDFLPDRAEAGTVNVPGIAGLDAGIRYVQRLGLDRIACRVKREVQRCAKGLGALGYSVFTGPDQLGTVSFLPREDCERAAEYFEKKGIALRAGLHCAPLAHESAGTFQTGTLRVSYGHDASACQTAQLLEVAGNRRNTDFL